MATWPVFNFCNLRKLVRYAGIRVYSRLRKKIFSGVFSIVNFLLGSQSIVTDITDPNHHRIGKLGQLNLCYGVGMICGMLASQWCTVNASQRLPAFIAATGSVLSLLLVIFFIPEQTKVRCSCINIATVFIDLNITILRKFKCSLTVCMNIFRHGYFAQIISLRTVDFFTLLCTVLSYCIVLS